MTGKILVPGSPRDVWSALLDPEVLKACIPGCHKVQQTGEWTFDTAMEVKVGPLKAKFEGSVVLVDPVYPHRVTLTGSLQGGASGFAKGQASMSLEASGVATEVTYDAEMRVGGKLAAVGDRLFGSAVKRNITDFFSNFEARLSGADAAQAVGDETQS